MGRSQDFISTEVKKCERRRRENQGAEGVGLGERRELPQRAPAANDFSGF